jgi:hypothetical protein
MAVAVDGVVGRTTTLGDLVGGVLDEAARGEVFLFLSRMFVVRRRKRTAKGLWCIFLTFAVHHRRTTNILFLVVCAYQLMRAYAAKDIHSGR